jgi:hypothetical protein
MDCDPRALEIIATAEKGLADLAASAASERDYGRAAELLAVAQRVANALQPCEPPPGMPPLVRFPNPGEQITGVVGAQSRAHNRTRQPSLKTGPSVGYPKFNRDDTTLVKIGWSKTDRGPYEHRSPREILDRLISRIGEVASGRRRFTTDDLLPLYNDDSSELPSYQCYLCLAWLVAAGLIERHGRQGYTVHAPADLKQSVEVAWNELPAR